MTSVAGLAAERFVSLTTFRRNGAPVATPVWVVADGADLLVWTPRATGKVKRLRNDGQVEMRPSNSRGRVSDGVPVTRAFASVEDDGASRERCRTLLASKYGMQFRLLSAFERIRSARADRVVLRIRDTPQST